MFLPVAAVAFAGLLAAMLGLPDVGSETSAYGEYATGALLQARQASDVVAAVTFDLRAFDTLGEELILFAAATACALLLRNLRSEETEGEDDALEEASEVRAPTPALTAPLVGATARLLVAPAVVLGAYVVSHGHVTPGGGFQGGVVLAAVALLLLAAGCLNAVRDEHPVPIAEAVDAVGAGAFVLLGLGGLVFAAAAFENFLAVGTAGELVSAGTIPLANIAVGVEVAAAFTLIFLELLAQVVSRR